MNKPVILAGWGCMSARDEFMDFINRVQAPVLLTWKAIGLLPDDHPLYCGRPGMVGQYAANRILQECDFLLVLGAKMDKDQTAYQLDKIALNAEKIVVDIDPTELQKFNDSWKKVHNTVYTFVNNNNRDNCSVRGNNEWLSYCKQLNADHPVINPDWWKDDEVNYYCFLNELSRLARSTDVISPECSNAAPALYQSWRVKEGQRFTYAGALGAMGSGLPGAIGAAFATGRRVLSVGGDGGFMLNMQELEVVRRHNLPIKLFIVDNGGYGAIENTQRAYFNGRFVGCNKDSGLTLPSIYAIAQAFEIPVMGIDKNSDIKFILKCALGNDDPAIVVVKGSRDFKPVHTVKKIMVDGVPKTGKFEDV